METGTSQETKPTPVHQSHLQGKYWNDRMIEHAVEFDPCGTFQAFYAAQKYLEELGYTVGSMSQMNPIGFAFGVEWVSKWHNLTQKEKESVDGIIIPQEDFREGGALILFFTPPRY